MSFYTLAAWRLQKLTAIVCGLDSFFIGPQGSLHPQTRTQSVIMKVKELFSENIDQIRGETKRIKSVNYSVTMSHDKPETLPNIHQGISFSLNKDLSVLVVCGWCWVKRGRKSGQISPFWWTPPPSLSAEQLLLIIFFIAWSPHKHLTALSCTHDCRLNVHRCIIIFSL